MVSPLEVLEMISSICAFITIIPQEQGFRLSHSFFVVVVFKFLGASFLEYFNTAVEGVTLFHLRSKNCWQKYPLPLCAL